MEHVRKMLALLSHAIDQYDDLQNRIAQARWRFEMLQRNPDLGIRVAPDGQVVKIAAEDIRSSMQGLETEAAVAEQVIHRLFQCDNVDAARVTYLDLLGAYNRWGHLRECSRLVRLGYPLHKLDDGNHATETALLEALDKAEKTLTEIAASIEIPAVSALTMAVQ